MTTTSPGVGQMINSTAWATDASNFSELQFWYSEQFAGPKKPKADLKKPPIRTADGMPRPLLTYSIQKGVAIIPVEGLIFPRETSLTRQFGAASAHWVAEQIKAAIKDQRVNSILLRIDCPGGSANGTPELAEVVFQASKIKPVVAFSESLMLGAGYWVASAANDVILSGPSVHAGCIGITMAHTYRAGANLVTTQISAGQFKTIASEYSPLSDAGRSHIQSQVNHLYSVFVTDVAKYRGTTPDHVSARMADGRTYIGQQAVAVGLADEIQPLRKLVASMAGNPDRYRSRRRVLAQRVPMARI